jgi:hypothetical protein
VLDYVSDASSDFFSGTPRPLPGEAFCLLGLEIRLQAMRECELVANGGIQRSSTLKKRKQLFWLTDTVDRLIGTWTR